MTGAYNREIRLVVSDVDGTLIDADKQLTLRTRQAVERLDSEGIAFAVTSSRPPRGLRHIVEALQVRTPIGGFNGGRIVSADYEPFATNALPVDTAREAIGYLEDRGVQVWVFSGSDWFVADPDGPHVHRETGTVRFEPIVVDSFDGRLEEIGKLVGVSDDHDLLADCERELIERLAPASVARSQDYYLDITHADANKGTVVRTLARQLDIASEHIMVLGDGGNDVAMFAEAGWSVAMGQASDAVKRKADAVTSANTEEGWANAIDTHVFGGR